MDDRPVPDWLARAVRDPAVLARYRAKVRVDDVDDPTACWYWTGAISGRGHGRFWINDAHVVIAHRYAYALHHPRKMLPVVIAHGCDNPLCQSPHPGHLQASTPAANRAEWAARRHVLTSPLRDTRGARGRATALRDAARAGADLDTVHLDGLPPSTATNRLCGTDLQLQPSSCWVTAPTHQRILRPTRRASI